MLFLDLTFRAEMLDCSGTPTTTIKEMSSKTFVVEINSYIAAYFLKNSLSFPATLRTFEKNLFVFKYFPLNYARQRGCVNNEIRRSLSCEYIVILPVLHSIFYYIAGLPSDSFLYEFLYVIISLLSVCLR